MLVGKVLGLKIEPNRDKNEPLDIVYFSDNDYAYDPGMRSESGFISFVLGVLIPWRIMAQRSVILWSSEAELVALSDIVKEVML